MSAQIALKEKPKRARRAQIIAFPERPKATSRRLAGRITNEVVQLSVSEQHELVLRHRQEARRMAQSMLNRWNAYVDREELHSAVDLALCVAASRYNPKKFTKFTTFLYFHLKGELVALVSSGVREKASPSDRIEEFESSYVGAFVPSNSSTHSDNRVSGERFAHPLESVYRRQVREALETPIRKLKSLERKIVLRVFLHDERVSDLAKELGYTRCHISRVKQKALKRLKAALTPIQEEFGELAA